jgi:hypothetical protein
MIKKITLLVGLFVAWTSQAQDAIVVSGGGYTGSGGSISYSVGQVLYTTNSGATSSVAQGVQQSYEIITLSSPELSTVKLSAFAYPNPATDKIVLSLQNADLTDLSYVLYDFSGRTLGSALVQGVETQIALQSLPAGVYILKVNKNNTELKTFKIIKK